MNTKARPKSIIYILLSIAVILWGFSFIWTNQLLMLDTPIFAFIFFRMLIAGLILLTVSLILKKLQRVQKKDIKWFLLMIFFEPFLYFICEVYGLEATSSPTLAAVIIATLPVFVLLFGQTFLKEKMSKANILGVLLTLPGIGLLVLQGGNFNPKYWWGIALLFIAVLSAGGYTIVVKRLTYRYNNYTITTYLFLLGALFLLPLFLIFDLKEFNPSTFFSIEVLKPLITLAVLCSSIAFLFYIEAIKGLGATKACIFTSLIPGVSAIGAIIYGHEAFTLLQLLGIGIVITGVILTQKKFQEKAR